MSDAHTPNLLSDADAAADLAGVPKPGQARLVSSEEARAMAAKLPHLLCAISAQEETLEQAAVMILQLANERDDGITLVFDLTSERDALAARVAELETEVLDQCRLNGMGSERELALMGRVMELEAEWDALRRALEIIAVGDATNPQKQAAEELIALGYWRDIPEARAALSTTPESKP